MIIALIFIFVPVGIMMLFRINEEDFRQQLKYFFKLTLKLVIYTIVVFFIRYLLFSVTEVIAASWEFYYNLVVSTFVFIYLGSKNLYVYYRNYKEKITGFLLLIIGFLTFYYPTIMNINNFLEEQHNLDFIFRGNLLTYTLYQILPFIAVIIFTLLSIIIINFVVKFLRFKK